MPPTALAAAVAVTPGAGQLPRVLAWVVAGVLAVLAAAALAFWVTHRKLPALPGTPPAASLHLDRFVALLERGEQPITAIEVRVAGTESLLLVIGSAMVACLVLLGFAALSFGVRVFVLLLLGVVFLPLLGLTVAIGNGLAERAARHGGRRAMAWSYPRSRGRGGMWPLVLTSLAIAWPSYVRIATVGWI